MPVLTAEQIKQLVRATSLGILSPSRHQEVMDWNAAEQRHRDENATARAAEPVKPRYTSEVRASELGVQIALRELELAKAERDSPQKSLHVVKLNRTLENFQNQLAQLKATHGIEHRIEKHTTDEQIPSRPTMPEAGIAALDLLTELNTIQASLLFTRVSVLQTAFSPLSETDAELCLSWNDVKFRGSSDQAGSAWTKLSEFETYRQCQILSARSAELVMQAYYGKLGFKVEDVSVLQIDRTTDEWKTYDLRVGDRLVDVKNARKSLHGGGSYVEHCVPRFKQLRSTGENVVIAGVLSEYLNTPNIYRQLPQSATVLGEVNVSEVRSLYRWAKSRFGPKLDLKGIWDPGFLPGWLFEYPQAHYPKRDDAIKAIAPLGRRLAEAGAFGDQLPSWFVLLCRDDGFVRSLPLEERKRKLILDLRSMDESIGISRRSLYVYAMGIALEALSKGDSPEEDLQALIELIEMPSARSHGDQIPPLLGLADPLGYVKSIVKTLSEVGKRLLELGLQLTGFRLTHPAILKGVCADGSLLTLIAYCGGWQTVPVAARCGTSPLTIVQDAHCSGCGHLICHNCGHCSNLCSACTPRQNGYASNIQTEVDGEENGMGPRI